jgi:hypothetical protein
MATRKHGKVFVRFRGGPFHGASFKMSPDLKSMIFKCKNFLGYYERGSWKSAIKDNTVVINDNFILGYN